MTLLKGNEMILLSIEELKDFVAEVARNIISRKETPSTAVPATPKRYVYGLRGICDLFNVSLVTAQKYKNTFLAPAISQRGRKITVDADMAMELFRKQQDECNPKPI